MRIGACLLFKNGLCYQSYRWEYFRPLGSLQNAVEILEERQVDEISIIRPCRKEVTPYSFETDLEIISNLNCTTPLSFGGGLRDRASLEKLHELPIERILLSSAYLDKNERLIKDAISIFGRQALIAVFPYRVSHGKIEYFHCRTNSFVDSSLNFADKYSNEVMFYDTQHDGLNYLCNQKIPDFPIPNSKIILSGGVNKKLLSKARKFSFAAVAFDNSFLHHEFNFSQL